MSTAPLPIDAVMADVLAALERARAVVIEAPPGAGKTTRVPLALLEAGLAEDGEIVVLQPRRIAARMSARRVAALLGEPVGERCGYQVRFESKVSSRTKIRFLTEGLLIARLLDDPQLRGVTTVILDEFHERHLDTDLALMALRRLQQTTRPDLRVLIMSATMDGQHVCTYFEPDPCPRIRSLGRMYPVTIVHTATARDRNLKLQNLVLRAFHSLVDPPAPAQPITGHVLVFLPGAREIRDCAEACAGLAAHHGFEIHRLHGELPPADQDRAVEQTQTKKLILSTNVAETSITIDGVVAVIDSGLHRQASHDPWSGLPNLELRPISRASAAQRAGRAGRTQAGTCVRLYSQHDHDHRPAYDRPEILRADLTAAILTLACLDTGVAPGLSQWLDAPAPAALDHATGLLRQLGALDEDASVTPEGRLLRRLPVHPRLAKVLVLGARSGITSCAAGAVALLSERSIYTAAARRRPASREVACDLRRELDDLELNRRASGASGLVPEACARVKRVRRQLEKLVRTRISPSLESPKRGHREGRDDPDALDAALCFALLASYPDRVAEVRRDDRGDRTVAFCQGGHAHLGKSSGIGTSRLVVALSIESRREGGLGHSWVSRAAAIEAEWLLDLVPDAIRDHNTLTFDNKRERVEGYGELRYGNVTLDRSRLTTLPLEAGSVLAQAAHNHGLDRLVDPPGSLAQLRRRIVLFASTGKNVQSIFQNPEDVPTDPEAIGEYFDTLVTSLSTELCHQATSFAELRAANLLAHIQAQIDYRRLVRAVPSHVAIPGRQRVQVNYEVDRPPWIASRLQDFFGLQRGPTIAEGQISLVLHLLAPNKRAVQVTTDLAGFWERHYPEQRRALMRRYPRHHWPEDPTTAKPRPPQRRGKPRRK